MYSYNVNQYSLGYPEECDECKSPSQKIIGLKVKPFYQSGNNFKIMLIGQDPTIAENNERVQEVFMLNDKDSELYQYITKIIAEDILSSSTIYATNIVKCTFNKTPQMIANAKQTKISDIIGPYFINCVRYLEVELLRFKPTIVITLGEATHFLFLQHIIQDKAIYGKMSHAFTGEFYKVTFRNQGFLYSPCIHLNNYNKHAIFRRLVNKLSESIKNVFSEKSKKLRLPQLTENGK